MHLNGCVAVCGVHARTRTLVRKSEASRVRRPVLRTLVPRFIGPRHRGGVVPRRTRARIPHGMFPNPLDLSSVSME